VSRPLLSVLYYRNDTNTDDSYDWIKGEMVRTKLMEDGPILHFVASIGAVRPSSSIPFLMCG
jgi:hypothetical protein